MDTDGTPESCFECGKPAEHRHHVIPRSKGGTQTVPLCQECHDLVHFRNDDTGSLLRHAYLAARAAVGRTAEPDRARTRSSTAPELDLEVTDSDREQARLNGATPEFYARLRAKVRARR